MSKSIITETISPEFLSTSDKAFLSDLVLDWLRENGNDTESFSFSIEVTWITE